MKKDFFTKFRESKKPHLFLPAFFALGIAFVVVGEMRGTPIDMKALSANVIGGLEEKVDYGADLLMARSGSLITLRMGQDAERVKSLYFTIIGDPSVFSSISGVTSGVEITTNTPGVSLVRVNLGRSLKAGEEIAKLQAVLSGETPLTVIDAGFSSESGEYSLSVKGE